MSKIKDFRGEHRYLSNFYISPVIHEGIEYSSSEAAFQAAKCKMRYDKIQFTHMKPRDAKRQGKKVELRSDWEQVKDTVMYEIVKDKFTRNADIRELLVSTEGIYLEEENTWGDTYWGVCRGYGLNKLGKILMQVRDELINKE